MAIISIDTTLDVVKKQKELAAALTDEDSIYIRMKETLVDLLEKGEIKGTDRANVVSTTLDSLAGRQLKQAQRIREYGIATTDAAGNVTSLANNGKVYQEELNVIQNTANKALLPSQIAAQAEEVHARTHKLVADTYVNHGVYTWMNLGVNKASTGYVTLSGLQKQVSKEQAISKMNRIQPPTF